METLVEHFAISTTSVRIETGKTTVWASGDFGCLPLAPCGGVEVRAFEGEGEASEISGGPHCCFPRFDLDARRGDGKLLHQRFHFFEGGGGASIRSRGLSVMRSLMPSWIDAKLEKLILDGQGFRVVGKLVTTAEHSGTLW